ncbi:MAG: hypothetical protein ICV73_15670 [Acetobacteraceae bacterium]|nr:hypothetical protein [Acetobacteraceae bacterium]
MLAALLLCWPAVWNGYPLVFWDTNTYLGQALLRYLGWDRPAFYSFFLLGLHWGVSLWPVVLAQALIVAHLLWLVLRALGRPGPLPLLLAAGGLCAATSLPFFAAQIMPDVFTGVVVLGLWLIGFRWDTLGRWERAYVLVLTTGAVAVHLSHPPLAAGLVLVGAFLLAVQAGLRYALRAAGRMASPLALAALALVAVNLVGHGKASLAPFSSVFFAARLIQDGPGLDHLRRACPDAGYRICGVLGRLDPSSTNAFLWDQSGPLWTELGGPKAWAPEAAAVSAATLREQPGPALESMLRNTLRQMAMADTGDGTEPVAAEQSLDAMVRRFFPEEFEAFRRSRQQTGRLLSDTSALAPLHRVLTWGGLVALVVAAATRWRHTPALALCLFVLAAAIGNALVTGGLSGPYHRYQARIAWLFLLAPAAVFWSVPADSGGAARATRHRPKRPEVEQAQDAELAASSPLPAPRFNGT